MQCPKCRHENPADHKFCGNCAYTLHNPVKAPSIEFTTPQSYTPKFIADKILTSRNVIEGERKQVTVLFADVAGFTPMAEKLDPEKIHQIMDGCFRILMDEVHGFQGTINQFTGDGIMALFGAPVANENHAQNACMAALAIQNSIKKYSDEIEKKFGLDFKMRIGLNSGPVIVGSIGDDLRMDYTAVGDTTNLAARMESMAKPGTILVSPVTYQRVSQQFNFKALGKAIVKGKKTPLKVYKLIEAKVDRPRLGLERQIYSEMVGRDNDLNRLELQINKAINGEGSVVNLIGEAVIGKSRLIAELRNSSVMKRVIFLEGRAISIGRNLSFHPIINLIKHWARIKDDDSTAEAYRKLEVAIKSVCLEDSDEIIPFVATLMGMKLYGRFAERVRGIEGEALEKLILKNVKDLITKSTELSPIVVVMEDCHWADNSSVQLLESLFRLAETQRILFINVFRPDHPETGDRLIRTIKEKLSVYYVEIRLQPLSDRMSQTLINNMLNISEIQHTVINRIIERSGGNPFFIEEVIRSFIDAGAVIKKNGEFEITDRIEKMVIPQTINDLLMARIDRLDEKTRELIKVAAVIGRSFFYRIITEVATAVEEIDNRLSYLKEIELIRERRRMDELEFLFKHALAQEAAYESILHQKRKMIHLQVAQSIEKVFRERLHEFYGMLALHYIKGEDLEKAEHYLLKAGEEALRSSASSEALNYYQEGLKIYLQSSKGNANPQKLAMLKKNIAIAFYNSCQWAEAVHHLDYVLNYLNMPTDPNKFPVLIEFAKNIILILISPRYMNRKTKPRPGQRENEIFDLMYKKVTSLIYVDNMRLMLTTLSGFNFAIKFDITQSQEAFNGIVGVAGSLAYSGLPFIFSYKLLEMIRKNMNTSHIQNLMAYTIMLTVTNTCSGKWQKIISFAKTLVDSQLKKGDLWNATSYMWFYSLVRAEKGDFRDAKFIIDELFRISNTYDYHHAEVLALSNHADWLIKKHRLAEAHAEAARGVEFAKRHSTELHQLRFFGLKAEAQILSNDLEGAKETFFQANTIICQHRIVPSVFIAPFLLARLQSDIHQLRNRLHSESPGHLRALQKEASRHCREALKKFKTYAPYRTKAYRLSGELCWLTGKQARAFRWWNKAVSEGQKLGARIDLSRTYFEIGRRLLEPDTKIRELNNMTAEEYLDKAKNMFEEMDLQWDLDELERVSAAGGYARR